VLNRASKWWMHPQMLVRLLSLKDSNGRPIFLTALEAPTAGGMGSILGYPVVPSFAAPTTNAANAKIAVFGDPGGLVVGMQNGFEFESSDHAGFTTYERYFRGIARAGVKVRRSQAFAVLTLPAS
jgi:HK97 family phage major capsid protein